MDVVVLGLGNILLGDEGVGVRAVERLAARYTLALEVTVMDGGTAGMDMLDLLAGRDHVVVVDAVHAEGPPGTVVRLAGDDVPAFFRTRISPHQLGLSELLAALELMGESPGGLTLIGVVPEDLDGGLELTATVAGTVDTLVALTVAELDRLGLMPSRKAARAPAA